ncbi:hypothetical protein BKA62DRAFT_660715 [Auriculariales sp. MPI-PUGE-AT-0066]|nr:hypothetical protein BKA62DRAFT_660715 [Auriculariales sp. MPI-PUGE-AT-0066]
MNPLRKSSRRHGRAALITRPPRCCAELSMTRRTLTAFSTSNSHSVTMSPTYIFLAFAFGGVIAALQPPDPMSLYTSTTPLDPNDPIMAGLPLLPNVTHLQVHGGYDVGRTYAHHAITEFFDDTLYVAWSSGSVDEDQMGQQSWFVKGQLASNWKLDVHSSRLMLPSALLSNQTVELNYTYWCQQDIAQRAAQPNAFLKFNGSVYGVSETWDIQCTNAGTSKYTRSAGRFVLPVSDDASTGCWLVQTEWYARHKWNETMVTTVLCPQPFRSQFAALLDRPHNMPFTHYQLTNAGTYYASDVAHAVQEVTKAVWFNDDTSTGAGYWQRFWRDVSGANSLVTWVEFSTNGLDWLPAVVTSGSNGIIPSNVPDSNTKTFFGAVTIACGPVTYIVHNPQYYPSTRWRQPLSISVAHDRVHFDSEHVIRTNASLTWVPDTRNVKRVGLSYPHATVAGDELIVAYSENKENIWLTRIPLQSLI